ncbi:unnamed protein product [Ectocarpus sp. 6 AP-2014]
MKKKVRFFPTGGVYDSVSSRLLYKRRLYERDGCVQTTKNFPLVRIHHGATPHRTTWVTSPRACAV